jgi:hypothetical protein
MPLTVYLRANVRGTLNTLKTRCGASHEAPKKPTAQMKIGAFP